MGNDDVLVLQPVYQVGKFIDMHVSAGVGPAGMLVLKEGALRYQDFAGPNIVQLSQWEIPTDNQS